MNTSVLTNLCLARVSRRRTHPEVHPHAHTPLLRMCAQTHPHTQRDNKLAATPETKLVHHRGARGWGERRDHL